jgi:hypothetical protein
MVIVMIRIPMMGGGYDDDDHDFDDINRGYDNHDFDDDKDGS